MFYGTCFRRLQLVEWYILRKGANSNARRAAGSTFFTTLPSLQTPSLRQDACSYLGLATEVLVALQVRIILDRLAEKGHGTRVVSWAAEHALPLSRFLFEDVSIREVAASGTIAG